MADKPSLRFADGGSLITRWARSVMRPDATANRLRQAEAPAPAPAAPPAPPPKVQDPSRVTADNPAGIRFQDGGVVPGKGKGDKIPAKYEPGEFVVSNDMIDDNPGLREGLSSLRAETLARRGKTVAEADAGIVTPKGLRAMDGGQIAEAMRRAQAKTMWRPAPANAPNFSTSFGAGVPNNNIPYAMPPEPINATTSPGAAPPTPRAPSTALVPVESGARQTVDRVGPRPTLRTSPSYPVATVPGETARGGYTGSAQKPNFTMGENPAAQSRAQAQAKEAADLYANARAAAAERAAGRGAPAVQPPLPPTMADKAHATLRNTWDEFRGAPKMGPNPKMSGTQKAVNMMSKGAAGLGGAVAVGMEAKDVYDVAADPNSTKTDVVEQAGRGATKLATSAMGSKIGAMAGSLGGPLAPITVPLGGIAGGIAGYYGGDKLVGGLREAIGLDPRAPEDRLQAQAKEQGPALTATPTKPAAPTNYRGKGYDDPRRVDMDPSRQSLGNSRDFSKELAGLPGRMPGGMREGMIYKTTDENGRTVYSGTNVREGAGFVDGRGANIGSRGSVNTVPGMSQAQIDATLTNPDGSRWSASDNAIMAANLRDGVDPYRGTSRGAAAVGGNQFQAPQNELYDGGGFGLLSNRARNERRLKMDAEQLKPGARTALKAFYEGEKEHRKNQTDVQRTAMSEDGALKRTAMTDGTTRRGQDMDLQGRQVEAAGRFGAKQAELQRDAALRQATAAMWQQAGGDPEKFQDLAMRNGLTDAAKTGGDIAGTNQNRRLASSKAAAARLESLAAGPDGKVDQNRLNQVRALANSISPGFESLTEEEQAVAMPKVLAAIRTVEGVNQLRDPTLTNMIGLSPDSPERRTLPDLKGASVEPVGILRGAVTPKVSAGDYRVTLANGNVVHLPRASTSEAELELLKAQGATLGTK